MSLHTTPHMSIPSIEFPLSPIKTKEGLVIEPIIPLEIFTPNGFKRFDFLVDSGADFTLLPRSLAEEVGVDLKRCRVSKTQGVEGRALIIYPASILINIGKWKKKIRCAFASHDRIPPLLGRLDIF